MPDDEIGCPASETEGAAVPICVYFLPLLAILLVASPARAIDLDQITVVTIGRDGSWGVATASPGLAIAEAVRSCRVLAATPSDCGAQLATTRTGWVIANLCGDHKIMVSEQTREGAEQAAFAREMNIRRLYAPDLPPCRRVVMVDPNGAVLLGQAARPPQIDARRGER